MNRNQSIEFMKKLSIGDKVLYKDKWLTVVKFSNCKWQNDGRRDICDCCVGRIRLENEKYSTCRSYRGKVHFDKVQHIKFEEVEFLSEDEVMF